MQHSVFVMSIVKPDSLPAIVEASNGTPEGPPFVRFQLEPRDVKACFIGKRYLVTIEEAE